MEELFEHHRIVVDKGQQAMRIDKYLVNRLVNTSRSKIQAATDAGNILVNEKAVKSNYKIKPEEVISIVLPHPPRDTEILPEDIPLNVVFEDEHILVINKNAGLVVHPGVGNYNGTLINALYYYYRDLPLFQTGDMRPGLVHRLDKNTSGILLIAKTEFALNRLARQFYDRTTSRKYLALVWGSLDEDEGRIDGHIGRDPKDRKKMTVFSDGSQGKPAVTHYKLLERLGYLSLVECQLETGRTHQIRVHFKHIRHPLFNDETYGGDQILKGTTFTKYKQFVQNCFQVLPRHALHAKSLGFMHPATGEKMIFDSDLPEDMTRVIEKWRRYTGHRNGD
jgi:23S rRNA pseudouridine1911/1915/1917 synthase